MPNRSGQELPCQVCGKLTYYKPSILKRGWTRMTCGSRECKSIICSGELNPFWGKNHTEESCEAIKIGLQKNPRKKSGPKKGEFTHSPEARAAISKNNKKRWLENRDLMMSYISKGEDHPYQQIEHDLRHRLKFTDVQKEIWIDKSCYYCGATEDLILDHIIPVMAGGKREKCNAQTLCEPCNRWKLRFVDIPFYFASLGSKGGQT